MNSGSINRRLAALRTFADQHKPAVVTVHFTDGTATVTTPSGALDTFRERGQSGEIVGFSSDNSTFGPWAQLLTILLNPLPNREVTNFEA